MKKLSHFLCACLAGFVLTPAPAHITCAKCGAATVYRFGKGGRFLSCSRYPDCDYAAPIDREGNPKLQPFEEQ